MEYPLRKPSLERSAQQRGRPLRPPRRNLLTLAATVVLLIQTLLALTQGTAAYAAADVCGPADEGPGESSSVAGELDALSSHGPRGAVSAAREAVVAELASDPSAPVPASPALLERLERTRAELAEISDPVERAQLEIHLGRSYMLASQPQPAAGVFRSAAELASSSEAWRLHSYALGYLGEIYESAGRSEDALALTARALASAEKAASPDAIYRWQAQTARLERAAGRSDRALVAYRAGVATIRQNPDLPHAETEPVYAGFLGLLLDQSERVDDEATRQSLLAEMLRALEDQNVSELRDYFRDPCLDARRKAAPDEIPGTLVVYPVLLPDRVALISSWAGTLESLPLAVDRETFVAEIRSFRRSLEDRTSRRYLRHADRLYQWIVGPLEPALARDDVETLVFVPRGALYTIPFAALYDRANKRFLIERIPLAITPGLTLTDPRGIDRETTRLLAAGVSESVQGFTPLAAVPEELAAISEEFPGRKLINQAFVADAFARELGEQPFGIVHVASHGEFSSTAEDSFILTYDGRLSMDRLASLVGKTRFRSQSLELLTLSACESAAGDDRAALGLAGVALKAGARSALATLWSVSDQASAALMIEFYQQLAQPDRTRAKALQQAQLSILEQRSYRHPIYWAPYLLINSWL